MRQLKKCTVIKSLLLMALLCTGSLVYAAPAIGTITHLSGPMLAQKADGTVRVLGLQSTVEAGDTLSTQKRGYAQIKFIDDSQLILQPDTVVSVDNFSYESAKPELDHADFTLRQGGLRLNAGLIGKRSVARVVLNTPTAKIVMQNATAVVRYVPSDSKAVAAAQQAFVFASMAALDDSMTASRSDSPEVTAIRPLMLAQNTPPAAPGGLAPGLYVQVLNGMINVSNGGGSTNFSAGQFGYTPTLTQPPVIVPANPGMQFTPPPAFSAPVTGTSGSSTSKPGTVDCVVR